MSVHSRAKLPVPVSAQRPTLLHFVGSLGPSEAERMVAGAHVAVALDLLARTASHDFSSDALIITDSPELAAAARGKATVEMSGPTFHFGHTLRRAVEEKGLARPFYVGRGSLPLLSADKLQDTARQLSTCSSAFITNNLYSSDMVAFTPGDSLQRIEPPTSDNALAQLLRLQAGLEPVELPKSAATQFDVDTPADLPVLALHPSAGRYAREYANSLSLDLSRVKAAMEVFVNPKKQLLLAGRVGSHVWSILEKDTACRVRMISEERGMKADGREEQGSVRSILGFYLERVGPRAFFQTLAELGDAAFIDTRVLFHHLRLKVSNEDRFLSDLGRPDGIQEPLVREFTRAALEAPIPVLLGGHSLLSGGLMALVEAAWHLRDQGQAP